MPGSNVDFDRDLAAIRQRFALSLILLGIACAPFFAFFEWEQGNDLAMYGDAILGGVLLAALLLIVVDGRFDLAIRFCFADLLLNWSVLVPCSGPAVNELVFVWWPVFALIVYYLSPSKAEADRWFGLFVAALIVVGLLFTQSGRMADKGAFYWSALVITLFTAFVVSRWLHQTKLYQQRLDAKRAALQEQLAQQRLLMRELAQAKKLEEIGLMTGGIAHDFNNLLSIIIGHTEVLHFALDEVDDEVAESLKMISLGATRGANLARELLAFAGKARFEDGPVCLDRIVQEMTTLQRIHMPKHIEMELQIRPVPALTGDSAPFEQVILNLVRNAIDAMAERPGKLAVATDVVELSGEEIATMELYAGPGPGRYICIQVLDEGTGIREEDRQRVFDPLFTTKQNGSGLGLASLTGTIQRYHGGLRLESEYGRGTTFTLYFPVPPEGQSPEEEGDGVIGILPAALEAASS